MQNTTQRALSLVITACAFSSVITKSDAAVSVFNNPSSSEITFNFSNTTTFEATRSTATSWSTFLLEFNDVYATDLAFGDGVFDLAAQSSAMTLTINSAPSISLTTLTVRTGGSLLEGPSGDLVFFMDSASSINITTGDIITIAGSVTFDSAQLDAPDDINRLISTEFNHRPTVLQPAIGSNNIQVSTASVPEPTSAALIGIGGVSILLRRRR